MKRHINLRLVLCLLAGMVVLGPCAYFLHAIQVKRTAGFLLVQATAAQEKGDLSKTTEYLSRYLALVPKDAEARAKLGLLLADDKVATTPKAMKNAYLVLDRALFLDGQRHDVRRRLVEVALHPWVQRFGDAAEHIEWFRQAGIVDAELLSSRARCYEAAGEFGKARECYEEAIVQPRKNEEDFVRLANLLRTEPLKSKKKSEKSTDETSQVADQIIEEMVATFKDSYKARLWSSRYLRRYWLAREPDKTRQRIVQDIEAAVALAPTVPEVLLSAAELELENHKPAAARAFLEKGLQLHAADWRLYQALARLEMEEKQPAAAMAALKRGLTQLPKQIDLIWNLAHLHLLQNQSEEAEPLLGRLAQDGCPQRELDYLHCRLLFNKDEWIQAIRRLERTYPQLDGAIDQAKDWFGSHLARECRFLLATCFERIGDPERARATYAQIVQKDPSSVGGQLGLARMEWAVGQLDTALRAYRNLLLNPDAPPVAWVECGQLLVVRNLKTAQANWAEVDDFLNQAAKLNPVPVEVAILRAEVLAAQKQFDLAREVLGKSYEDVQERPIEVWIGLSELERRRGKNAEALAILTDAQRRLGDHVELRIALARYWSRQVDGEAVSALGKLSTSAETWPAADQRRLAEELAAAYLRMGESKRAETQWRKIAAQRKTDVGSRLVLFDLAFGADDEPGMGRLVDELKEIEGEEGTLWRYCQARRLIWKSHKQNDKTVLGEASNHLAVVAGRRVGWFRVPAAQGQIFEMLGKYESALSKYTESIAMGNLDPAVYRRVILLLSSRGRYLEADKMLQKLKEQTGSVGDLDRVAAEVALAKQDATLAMTLAKNAVSPQSTDYRDHMWLGQILWAADKMPEAEAAFRQAAQLNTTNPEPWVALVQFFLRTNDKAKAEKTVREAEVSLAKDQALVPLAFCHELIGNIDRAKQLFDEALAAKPGDVAVLQAVSLFHIRRNRLDLAKQHLDTIIKLNAGSPEELAQTRRVLALVLASSGSYQQTQEALKILGVLQDVVRIEDASPDANIGDERAKAIILARQTNPRQKRQAIAILEKVARLHLITNDEQYLLAQLYESVGEWPKANAQFLLLLKDTQDNLEKAGKGKESLKQQLGTYLAAFCINLLRHDAIGEADVWLAKLEQLDPGSFRTVGIKARVRGKQGRGLEAIPALVELASKKADFMQPVAMLLEEIGQHGEAEKMYHRFVSESKAKTPENVLILAAFWARRNRADDALAVCEAAWQNCKPEAVAGASVHVLYTTQSHADQWQRVAGWLERECVKQPANTALLDNWAAVLRLQKDYQGVIALCRRILVVDKTDTTTMNNLAWLLALHDKNGEEGLKIIQRAIELKGPNAGLLDTRAVVLMKLGKANQAISDLEDAVAEAPSAHYYFHLAQAHLLANNQSAAVVAFHQAKRLGLNGDSIDPLEKTDYEQIRNRLERL